MHGLRNAALVFALPAIACQSIRSVEEARWFVDVNPVASIDWDSDIDGYDLHDVKAAMLLSDGRIAVVDGGSAEIRWFDLEGAFLGRLGGDTIFHRILDATRGGGDTIVVRTLDPAIVRVDGRSRAVIDRVALPPAIATDPCTWVDSSLSPDGSIVLMMTAVHRGPCGRPPEGAWRRVETLARFDPVTGRGHSRRHAGTPNEGTVPGRVLGRARARADARPAVRE